MEVIGSPVTCRGIVGLDFSAEGGRGEVVGGVIEAASNHKFSIQSCTHHVSPRSGHAGNIQPSIRIGVVLLGQV